MKRSASRRGFILILLGSIILCISSFCTIMVIGDDALDVPGSHLLLSNSGPDNTITHNTDYSKLNIGEMAAFRFNKKPEILPQIIFENAAGEKLSLQNFIGKVILLNLWATWCAPCLKEIPYLEELQLELGDDTFEVVAINLDRDQSSMPRDFLRKADSKAFQFYHDPTSQLFFTLKATGMPTTFLIDSKGHEIGRLVGAADWHHASAIRLIKAFLPN